jgi:hypothetical protein
MFIQDTPPDTSAYMIAGYAIFFVFLIIYLVSLFIRSRNLNEDLVILEGMENQNLIKEDKLQTGEAKPVRPRGGKAPPAKRKTGKTRASKSNPVRKKVARNK